MADHPDDNPTSSKTEVQARLSDTAASIRQRIEALREEAKDTPASVRDVLRRHPLLSLGGVLAVGLLAGYWWSGRRSRRTRRTHQALIDHYIDALRDEVQHAVAGGEDIDTAVKEALRHRTPLVVFTAEGKQESSSWLRNFFDVVVDTALALFVREGLHAWLGEGDLDQEIADLAALEDE